MEDSVGVHGMAVPKDRVKETLNHSAFPVWGRTPQREQRHKSLIRGIRRGHAPRRDELKKSTDGFFQHFLNIPAWACALHNDRAARETLKNSAFPVWGRTPQREQRRTSLIRG
ncbi:MAG: hypothetical protein ACPLXR_03915, partial [Halothiobacillaceae bacterium]